MPPVYALNLFNLAANEDYRAYSRRSADAVGAHNGRVVALGSLEEAVESDGAEPRSVMILVEWDSREDFDRFRADPALADLHPLRENGTTDYLWWVFEKLHDLRPVLSSLPPVR